jgi:mercuric ion binding protein
MKTNIKIALSILLCCFILKSNNSFAQVTSEKKTETFKVYGNCDMCKEKIEGALNSKDGIFKKGWSPKTKILTVTYDPAKITASQIKQKIAAAGYDTDEVRAKDENYNSLPKCCQYERPKK